MKKKFELQLPSSLKPTHIPVGYKTHNIGDDIQAEAACRFFNIRTHVDRDLMSSWPKDSLIPLIGWYGSVANNFHAFDTSKQCLIISTHISPVLFEIINNDTKIKDWFKAQVKNQGFPALCRDLCTRDFLRCIGVDAEFNGCITTSLKSRGLKKERLLSIDFGKKLEASLENFDFFTQMDYNLPLLSPEERLIQACNRIDLYDSAKKVMTSRLHVFLPCQALNTDVVLNLSNATCDADARFSGHM
jgi:hypothetical protein